MQHEQWMQREPVTRSGGWLLRWFSAGLLAAALTVLGATVVSAQAATPEPGEEAASETAPETGAEEAGVLVVAVDPGSPAADAGLARGDIILTAGETAVNTLDELRAVLLDLGPGDALELTYRHGDDERRVEVTLGEREGRAYLGVQLYSAGSAHTGVAASFMMAPAMPLGMPAIITATRVYTAAYPGGVIVTGVVAGGPAEAAGLAAGDVITALEGEALADINALQEALARHAPGDEVILTVLRGGLDGEEKIAVTLGAAPHDDEQAFLGIQTLPGMMAVPAMQTVLPPLAYPAIPYGAPYGMPYMMPYAMPYYAMPYPMPGMPYGAPFVMPLLPAPPVSVLHHGANVLYLRRGVVGDGATAEVFIGQPPAETEGLHFHRVVPGGTQEFFTAPALPSSPEPVTPPSAEETL